MTDRDFLELFHKIDDKFIEEAQHDQRRRRISKQHIFNTLSTMAACMAVVIGAVLLVSSFINSGQFALMNSGSAVQTSSGDLSGAAAGTSSEDSSQVTPSDQKLCAMNSTLSFPKHRVELDLPKEDCYAAISVAETETVSAVFAFSVQLYDGSLDTRIPARMYVFADGQPIRFQYRGVESPFRDFTIVPEADYSLPIMFEASEEVSAISIVCVFFPGDAERQTCLIHTAGNVSCTREVLGTFGVGNFIGTNSDIGSNFVTVTNDPDLVPKSDKTYWDRNIPADSAYVTAYLSTIYGDNDERDDNFIVPNPHYLIALVNGKPVNVFESGDPLCLNRFYYEKDLVFQYRIPEEYLPENSTLQIIALPAAVTSWRDADYSSDCFGVV